MDSTWIELKNLLFLLKENIPYYRKNIPDDIYIIDKKNDLMSLFENLSISTKNDFKKNYKEHLSDSLQNIDYDFLMKNYTFNKGKQVFENSDFKYYLEFTSGTSGNPFIVFKSLSERIHLGNTLWNLRNNILKVTPNKFIDLIHSDGYPFPFERDANKNIRIKKELDYLSNSSIIWWHASPNKLNDYYESWKKERQCIKPLKIIEYNGAFLSKEDKLKYETAWKCRIVNNYGCKEVWTIAYECKYGHLHCNEKDLYVEIVNEKNVPIKENDKLGYVIVTSKILKNVPFVRYKTGDIACFRNSTCNCGCRGRIIEVIPARECLIGTNINGNELFKKIIKKIIIIYDLNNFGNFYIRQINSNTFIVNVSEFKDNKDKFEFAFKKISNLELKNEYQYKFTYENITGKTLFSAISNENEV